MQREPSMLQRDLLHGTK